MTVQSRQERLRVAAEWAGAVTGLPVPAANERAFRAALCDGVVLAQLANTAFPGVMPQVRAGWWFDIVGGVSFRIIQRGKKGQRFRTTTNARQLSTEGGVGRRR